MDDTVCNSEYKGIHWENSRSKWYAKININGTSLFLGRFENKADAREIIVRTENALILLDDMNAVNIHDASIKRCHKSIAGFVSKDGFNYKVELQINGTEPEHFVAGGEL